MTTERRWVRPGIRRVTTDRWGRWYEINGKKPWSVTTLIRGGTSNKALQIWEGNTVAYAAIYEHRKLTVLLEPDTNGNIDYDGAWDWLRNAPDRAKESAAATGTQLHDYAEAWVKGEPRPEAVGRLADLFAHFLRWLETWQPSFEMVEALIYSDTEQYAGTLDAIIDVPRYLIPDEALALITGIDTADLALHPWRSVTGSPDTVRLIIDYKTGKGVYQDVALQLSAYRHCEFIALPDGTEQHMLEVDGAAVVHIRPEGYEFIPVATGKDVWQSFLYVREVYRWSKDIGKGVIGAGMVPVTQLGIPWDELDDERRIRDIENPPEDDETEVE